MENTHMLVTDQGTFRLSDAPREELERALVEAYEMLAAERDRAEKMRRNLSDALVSRASILGRLNPSPMSPSAFRGIADVVCAAG